MNIVTRTAKKSPRLFAIVFLITLVSTIVTASRWESVTAFAQNAGSGFFSNKDDLTIGTCDTAGPIEVESSGGTTAPTAYATLKAAFDAVIAGTHTGTINVEVCGNTTETATAALTASGVGAASYTSVTIRPVGAGRVIEGSIVGAIVRLQGADNVTIDGRQGGAGTARDLTIRNNNTSTATAAIWLSSVAAGNGASANVVRNLEIAAGQTANTGTNTTIGVYMGGTTISLTATDGNDNDNNQFIANRITRARYGLASRGVTTNNNEGLVILDNIIGPNSFGADEIGKAGIFLQADTGALVSRNTVQFVGGDLASTTAGADRCGICIGGENWSVTDSTTITSGDYTVTKNFIHDIIEERTFSAIGIKLGTTRGGTATNNLVANNFIYNIRADSTTGDQVVGIGYANGHTDRIVNNSISLTGDMDPGAASLSTTYGNAIRVTQANGTNNVNLLLTNNSIYLDASSSTAANRYYAITLNSNAYAFGTGALNYNNYYINASNTQLRTGGLITTGTGSAATTEFQTLANWQAALTAPQDANSIQVDPLYISNTADLHLQSTSLNINAGLAVTGVTDDIDSQVRPNGANPDIGADEFYALPGTLQLSSATYGGTEGNTVTVTVNRVLGSTGTVGVTYTLTNGTATGGAACGAGVDFVNPGPQLLTFGDSVTSQQFNVTLCSDLVVDQLETFTVTLSSPTGGASLGSPTSATVTITDVAPPFNGSFNVGAGQTYTSLTNTGGIFEALNLSGATGNVTINITSDLAGETGTFALNELAGGFSVLIKPSGGNRSITGSSTNSIIRLNGADNVTIDGSLSGGSATGIGGDASLRNLTVQNTNTAATAGAVIAIMQGANSANDNIVKNVIVSGQDPTQTLIGIHVGGNAIGAAPTTASNNNVVVDNCAFQKSFIAVFNDGVSAAIAATGNAVTHNDISATGANRMRRAGIFLFNHNGIQVTENKIGGIVADEAADAIGIIAGVQNVNTTVTTSGGIYNANISRNKIDVITSTSTTGFSAVGIAVAGDPLGANTISNNMITGVSAPSTSPDFVAGIFVAGVPSSNTRLYYNSVSNTGARGAVASQIGSYGVAISGSNPTVELKNNIFYNTQTSGGGAAAKSYSIGMTSTTFTNLDSNYNDFFTSGANAGGFRTGSLDTTGTDLANLAAWQTAVSDDANSQEVDPLFVDPITDLHLQAATPLENDGTPIAAVTVDFDNNPRSATTPEIGADELFVLPTVQFNSATYTGAEGTSATVTVTRTGDTSGASSVNYATSNGTATGGASCGAGVDYVTASGTLNFAATDTSKTFNVQLCSDAVAKGDETVNVTLTSPTGATLGAQAAAVLTITNVAPPMPGSVQFAQAFYTVGEGGGSVTLTVTRTGGSSGAISVNYVFAGGTASGAGSCAAGIDYAVASGTLNWADGDSASKTFNVAICEDALVEGNENFLSFLNTPTGGATIGAQSSTDVTITDNDSPPVGPVTVTASAGTATGTYNTLTEAIAAVNAGTHQGNIVISINQNTTEPGTVVINSTGAGAASYTSLLIRPTADGLTVAGASLQGRGLIELNGADNVTIDGDNPDSAGINRNLTLQNTAANTVTFTSVIRIALAAAVTTADGDTFKNLNILGSATGRNIGTANTTTGTENNGFGILAGLGATGATTAPAAIASVTTGAPAGTTAANLVVSNNSVTTTARAVSINGAAATVFPGLQIKDNRIGNLTAGATDQVYAIGITAQGSPDGLISGNTVWVESFSPTALQGINVSTNSTVGTFTIENNKVNRVRNSNTTTFGAYGINLGGSTNHIVRNNFVSGVINDQTAGTGAFSTTFGAFGIRILGTGHKVYHNSVHLYGAMGGVTSTNLTAALGIVGTTQTGVDVRNNIFSNQITGGNPTGTRNVAVALPSGATSAMNLTINNNAYFVGADALNRLAQVGVTFGTGEYQAADFDPTQTTPATNFRAYTSTLSAAGTNDNASFASTSPPPFTSNVDLHIPAGTPTRLESGGAAVGVTTDIDAETRNATTPDIGADEFAGNPPAANDIAATGLITPTNGATIPTNSAFSPQARFTNNGTATQTSVTVRYRIIDSSMTTVYNQTQSIATIAPLQSVIVTFPSTSLANPGSYTIQASVELAGDTFPGNDSISGTINAVNPIGGTISVGTGQTYTSLTNPGGLFEALNLAGISGNLTVNITSDLTGETGAVALNQLAEAGAGGYTATFKPSGAARTISGTSAATSALIILNGADRIVFDGSLSGGTDRSLTITNNQATTGVVIWMRSPNASNGATNNTVKNCILNGAPGPNSTTVAGVLTGSGTTLGNDAEAPNSNNTIQNNWIYRVQNSLYLRGGTTAPVFDQNWTVTGNELGSTNANDKNIFRGMLIGNSANFTISGNTVHGIQSTATTTASMSGIQLALLLSNGTVTNNQISDIKNVSATGTGASGISIIATSTASNVTIANNFISDVAANGSATIASNGHGIAFQSLAPGGSGYNLYFNSVNLNTNQATAQTSAAMFITATFNVAGAINARNNIFANTQTTGARYAVYNAAPASVFAAIDYNDYFAQNVGFLGSTRTTLADWQAATGGDANSKAVDPLFVSPTNLHLQPTSTLLAMGVSGTGITTDIDGQTRDTPPDIGADEVLGAVTPGTVQFAQAFNTVGEGAGSVTISVTRTGGSSGAVGVNYVFAGGTATGASSCSAGIDYAAVSGTLNWADGDTAPKTFNVTICEDLLVEGNENFLSFLNTPTGGATVGTQSSTDVTITDNDVPAGGTITVNDVRVLEGNTGGTNAVFTVTYTGANPASASVQYATANGTALAGVDFLATSGTLNFSSGSSLTVAVPIIGKSLKEANETFFLNLSNPVNATIADNQGVGIIVDEDRTYTADFDRDLYSDLSVFRPSEGKWYVFNSASSTPNIVSFGVNGDIPVPGDYDGDGKTDIANYRPSEGKWYIGSSINTSVQIKNWGTTGDKPVQGDYDGDGKTDIAVFRPSTGQWWIVRSTDNSTYTVNFGIGTDRLMQGDYDGDFKTDEAVYRDGTWYILLSSNSSVVTQNFGLASDKPVSGDFDGDGKYDIAVFRNGTWWVFNSLTGTAGAFAWGTTGDIPVPADYDRDGTTDYAIFRPSTGQWFVYRSSNGSYFALVWGTNGDIPIPSAYVPQ
ncbi:MAG TPA: Calx-beta domain-containing protein [Pyrinomonadaceae bacterium]|jgi:hypothetical protein